MVFQLFFLQYETKENCVLHMPLCEVGIQITLYVVHVKKLPYELVT